MMDFDGSSDELTAPRYILDAMRMNEVRRAMIQDKVEKSVDLVSGFLHPVKFVARLTCSRDHAAWSTLMHHKARQRPCQMLHHTIGKAHDTLHRYYATDTSCLSHKNRTVPSFLPMPSIMLSSSSSIDESAQECISAAPSFLVLK